MEKPDYIVNAIKGLILAETQLEDRAMHLSGEAVQSQKEQEFDDEKMLLRLLR